MENKTLHTFSYIPPSDFVDFTPKQLMPDERPFIKTTVEYVGGILKIIIWILKEEIPITEIDDMLEVLKCLINF